MKRFVIRLNAGLLLVLTGAVLWAQAVAQISGTVKDQSGAVLPGVEVTATQTDTGISRAAITNETGSFILPSLPTGPYRLEAALPGFRAFVQTGIVLQVNSNPVINPVMEVGQVTEQVEVQANATLVETRSQGVGQVIENERILELPLNGRQVTDLITLAGAAVQNGASNNRSIQGVPAISVAGGFTSGTVYTLDGAMHNDVYNNLNLPLPFPDALQEFKVETSARSAQYGMYSGATVSSVTKSGTNEFHGDLFEFVRNDLFNARNYFATKNSTLKRNQFGGTFGGPIVKNRLFFFGGYQETTVRQDPADNQSHVPTAAMLAGDFTAVTSPACNGGRQITLSAASEFAGNRIDPALFSKAAVAIANKLPKTSDPCGLVIFGQRVSTNEAQYIAKTDFQWNAKHSVFGRYLATAPTQAVPFNFDQNLLTTPGPGFDNLAQSITFGDTYLVNSNTVSSFRLSVNRVAIHRSGASFFTVCDVGVNAYCGYLPKYSLITVTGGFSIGNGTGNESTNRTTTYQTGEDLSLARGTHQLAFGANLAHWRSNFYANVYSPLPFTFNGQTTGLGLADFLVGRPSSFLQSVPNTTFFSEWYFGTYAADTWKVTPKLTVNYGVRWEPYFPQVIRNGATYTFSEDRYQAGVRSTVFANAPAGLYFPGDPGFQGKSGWHKQWNKVAPRLGFAWDPSSDGRMSVRASYAMGFDMLAGQINAGTTIAPPYGSQVNVSNPPGGFENPWQGYPGGNPFPLSFGANALFVPYGSYTPVQEDLPTSTRHMWNLSVQRQLSTDWLASASYVGSQATHLLDLKALNTPVYIPGGPCTINGVPYNPCSTTANENARRRLTIQYPNIGGTTYGFLDTFDAGGNQSYDGLLLSLQRRAAKGITVGTNYTWSHCWGDQSRSAANPNAGSSYVDPNNRSLDRGNCDVDRRQIFNLTAVAQTPQFAAPALRMLATGWRLSGIYRRSTGSWLTITSGVDRALTGISSQRPDQVLANVYGDKSSLKSFLNPAAFTLPAVGSNGNMATGNVEGPGTWSFDLALSRTFRLTERQNIEVRVEAFNVTNSLRRLNPAVNLSSGTFGQITTASDPRILQFAMKYVF